MSEYALRLANSQDTAPRVRAGDALGLTPNGTVRARGGLRPDGGGVVSIVSGTMNSQVTPFSCWVDASPAGQVGYPFVCDATKTLTHDPGDATLVRVDTIAVVVKENAYDGSGATTATLQIVKGTPGAGAPAMPTSACIPLRNINVPAGASTGTGGMTSGALGTDQRVSTVAAGGVLPVATQAERDALFKYEGLTVYRKDTDRLETYDGASWHTIGTTDAPTWSALSLLNGWVSFGAPYGTPRVAKVNGIVYVQAMIKNGTATNATTLFNLPAGMRPSALLPPFSIVANSLQAGVVVYPTGDVNISFGGSSTYMAVVLSFPAEQ